jgi:hydrogenase maturation protein HypF
MEERVLRSMQAPIVLLNRLAGSRIAPSVAPGSPTIGAMLPYSPLHYLLLAEIGRPVVATSGNLSDEPICTDETEVLNRLSGIADLFLVHDRGIARHVDDSVVQVVLDREMVLRRARGYAPLPATLAASGPPILAVGAHQKSAVALSVGDQAFVSQHIGDLESVPAYNAFTLVIGDLSRIYEHAPQAIACDMHPDYLSTQYAVASGLKTISVQHHYAHVLSCMADNRLEPPVLGIAWDGSGLGSDDTLWGGEFLLVEDLEHRRIASLRPFRLPGGASAAREPRRCALGILAEMSAADDAFPAILVSAFNPSQIKVLRGMIEAGINSPITTSIGRLFDAVAALTGIRETVRHEGQAAMELEFAARRSESEESYRMPIVNAGDRRILDWEPMIRAIIEDSAEGRSTELIARRFHNTLAEAATAVATHANADHVALTGGCFQNRLLTECCVTRLRDAGLQPYWHQRIPPNDGGIAVGQILAAHRAMGAGEK